MSQTSTPVNIGRELPRPDVRAPATAHSPAVPSAVWNLALVIGSVFVYEASSVEQRHVVLPALVLANILILLVATLWRWDARFPVFEIGAVCGAVTALYSIYPLLSYLLSGMTWTELSDSRLQHYRPSPEEFGGFAWRHVLYLFSFSVAYLAVRGRCGSLAKKLESLDPTSTRRVILSLGVIATTLAVLEAAYDVTFSPKQEDMFEERVQFIDALPYVWQQFAHNLIGIKMLLQQCVLFLLIQRWGNPKWRFVLIAWLLLEVLLILLKLGARTEVVILLFSTMLLFDRIIRPIRPVVLGAICTIFLGGFLLFGWLRAGPAYVSNPQESSRWSANNEMQSVFGTSYDLHELGASEFAPKAVLLSEFVQVIPSQLLPFEKQNGADWYLDIKGWRGLRIGFTYGVISQAVLGFDWPELVLRGLVLGWFLARIHRWYILRSSGFRPTLFYLFLCSFIYLTFRDTTGSIVYLVCYRFVPLLLLLDGVNLIRRTAAAGTRRLDPVRPNSTATVRRPAP